MDYDRLRELQEKYEENPRRYFAPLANEYRKGGQVKRAIEICRAQLAQMPGHMSGQIVYGQSLYEAGEFDEARQVFQRALALDPENLIALRSLGDMSLQAGDTAEARTWYARLLEADPKDVAVIALITEIDAAADAGTPAASELSFIDTDTGDHQIPAPVDEAPVAEQSAAPAESQSPAEPDAPVEATSSPVGLERHYPAPESPAEEAPTPARSSPGLSREDLGVPDGGVSAAEGLTSHIRVRENPLDWGTPAAPVPAIQEPLAAAPALEPEAPVMESASHSEPPPPASEQKTSSGASGEPFVNETMAQLYLQQGYKQLALQVYRQLAVARPRDEGLRQRIAEIEAADAAEHPSEATAPRQERPTFDRAPAESPPSRSAERESTVARSWEEPRAEPEPVGARQPSIKEFFATLGRRRPPQASPTGGSRSGNNQFAQAAQPADARPPMGAAPGASLDSVFAGATVDPSDARAASRLAGAFSGATGASRTPPTPPMPTPRVNPRMPQAQESEEDVAKFRAWLDGLTGE